MCRFAASLVLVAFVGVGSAAHADRRHGRIVDKSTDLWKKQKKKQRNRRADCFRMLRRLGVKYSRVRRRGIRLGVRVTGPIGGVHYKSYKKKGLVLDCSLVVSLAISGRYLRAQGIDTATYSSAYQIRNIRGSRTRSQHSYGLALDVHTYSGPKIGSVSLEHDYEQGLGDDIDCIGRPLTPGGALLRTIDCQMSRSGLFRMVLNPDYNTAHYNHFHIEAHPWRKRIDVKDLLRRQRRVSRR
jgi:hypothetical protein